MIPRRYIIEWKEHAPWPNDGQVEQDLVIKRALVQLFSNSLLKEQLAFRGGTALHKIFLKPQVRYSEDIDLVQIAKGPIGPILDAIRKQLKFLGAKGRFREENIDGLDIYWFVTFDKTNRDLPGYVEGLIMQIYFERYGSLPAWNNSF